MVDGDKEWEFVRTGGRIMHINQYNRLDKMREIEKFGFEKHPGFASARGYIWSRTFPLLKYNMFVGSGPDTYVYEFPNDDYIGSKYVGFGNNINIKPHNIFLQIWVQDGFIITGLANDSTTGVTPICFTMLGVGYAAEAVIYQYTSPSIT